jgi:hypothetical protein
VLRSAELLRRALRNQVLRSAAVPAGLRIAQSDLLLQQVRSAQLLLRGERLQAEGLRGEGLR